MNEFTGIWLPAEILAITDLNLTEKVLAAQVVMLSRVGVCRAQNDHLASQTRLTTTTVSQTLKHLKEKGYIIIEAGKEEGNKRIMYPSLKLLQTLCKNLTEGWQKSSKLTVKVLQSLYKILTDPLQDSYRPYVKILQTLFKDFTEPYIRTENKDENKGESKIEKKYTVSGANAPTSYWSVLKISFSDHQKWLAAEQKKIYASFPPDWTTAMIELYQNRWLPFRQNPKVFKKKLRADSIQAQINELSPLTESELTACINNSISNGYQGLFPEKFKQRNGNTKNTHVNGHRPSGPRIPISAETPGATRTGFNRKASGE
ncbi:hypothetical protein [Spirosoma aerolatum]|uniref:hypothetical protein n=1 Tax=Spirosoma aerolatum TaxID=1211326 RepID=UPI0009ACF3B8|nr:hypothetical protein [Spirosoma aerolatum]